MKAWFIKYGALPCIYLLQVLLFVKETLNNFAIASNYHSYSSKRSNDQRLDMDVLLFNKFCHTVYCMTTTQRISENATVVLLQL